MVHAIFYMHQTSGACADVCACNGKNYSHGISLKWTQGPSQPAQE